jgi:hypothetical protein
LAHQRIRENSFLQKREARPLDNDVFIILSVNGLLCNSLNSIPLQIGKRANGLRVETQFGAPGGEEEVFPIITSSEE